MQTRYRRRLAAAVLALVLLAGGPAPAPALAQNERPDLAIELVGLSPNNPREVRLRVRNVGQWWADATSATVETTAPTAGNKETTKVPDLDPKQQPQGPTPDVFEFTYKLAADCDGHAVKASLAAAKTFNGNTEANLANNTVGPTKLCAAKSQPAPKPGTQSGPVVVKPVGEVAVAKPEGILISPAGDVAQANPPPRESQTRIGNEIVVIPEHLRPGLHGDGGEWPPLVFEPSAALWKLIEHKSGVLGWPLPDGPAVGWSQFEGGLPPLGGDVVQVAQTAVAFDLSKLDEVPRKDIIRATLTFDEVAARWTDGEGRLRFVRGCVSVLGVATVDWANQRIEGLFPNRTVASVTPQATSAWDVTAQVRDRAAPFGYVLRGSLEENLEADDDSSCMSTLSNIRLTVVYRVTE